MVKIQIILLWIKLARFVSNIEKWDFLSDFQTLWWYIPAKHSIAAGVRQASTSHGSHSRTFGACGRRWFWASEKWEEKKTKKIIAILSIFSADAVIIFLTSGLWQTRFWARQNVYIYGTTETWAGVQSRCEFCALLHRQMKESRIVERLRNSFWKHCVFDREREFRTVL